MLVSGDSFGSFKYIFLNVVEYHCKNKETNRNFSLPQAVSIVPIVLP